MSKPTSADYKFFYHILEQYRSQYCGDTQIDELPEFYLNPSCSIDYEMAKILEKIDLTGEYVIVEIPVQFVAMDLRHSTVLDVIDTDVYFTFGRVIGKEDESAYQVQYKDKTGHTLTNIFMAKDILYWGKSAYERRKQTWNYQEEKEDV